jgi:hypothetical protein
VAEPLPFKGQTTLTPQLKYSSAVRSSVGLVKSAPFITDRGTTSICMEFMLTPQASTFPSLPRGPICARRLSESNRHNMNHIISKTWPPNMKGQELSVAPDA